MVNLTTVVALDMPGNFTMWNFMLLLMQTCIQEASIARQVNAFVVDHCVIKARTGLCIVCPQENGSEGCSEMSSRLSRGLKHNTFKGCNGGQLVNLLTL